MTTTQLEAYRPRTWPGLRGLHGISDHTLEVHFGLYEGYVKNTNLLNEQIAEIVDAGKAGGANLEFAELTRRLSFESNGMRLHEYYFDNLTASASGRPSSGALHEALRATFGDVDKWQSDFAAVGAMRGVGWAIAYQDPTTGRILNVWVTLHEEGTLAGFVPILVMDVWEHAFMFDYKPSERGKYIEAFFANVDWKRAEDRLRPAIRRN
jgi:superoxide dismutase, Fe-Mn family